MIHKPWLFIVLAGLLEIGWAISLKQTHGFTKLIPTIRYALFGMGSAYCLAQAMKALPASISIAVWMGIAVVGTTVTEAYLHGNSYSILHLGCIVLILGGIIGLKLIH